jgi:hypothetical protein
MNLTNNQIKILQLMLRGDDAIEITGGRVTPAIIEAALSISASSASQTLSTLHDRGLVVHITPDGIKNGLWQLTEAGAVVAEDAEAIRNQSNPTTAGSIENLRSAEAIIEDLLPDGTRWDQPYYRR